MPNDERRKELSRLMMEQPNGLELVMNRYQEVLGHFPPMELTPNQIIDAILQHAIDDGIPSGDTTNMSHNID